MNDATEKIRERVAQRDREHARKMAAQEAEEIRSRVEHLAALTNPANAGLLASVQLMRDGIRAYIAESNDEKVRGK